MLLAAASPLASLLQGGDSVRQGSCTPTSTAAVAHLVEAVEHMAQETSVIASPG